MGDKTIKQTSSNWKKQLIRGMDFNAVMGLFFLIYIHNNVYFQAGASGSAHGVKMYLTHNLVRSGDT
jgi:hypothetical protein